MTKHSPIIRALVRQVFDYGAAEIRDVDNGEEAFLYTSGNHGPGYIMVKGLVSQRRLLEAFLHHLAVNILERFPDVEYVAGNVTGGVIPGWELARILGNFLGREIPYVYVRETRKQMGQREHITGDKYNKAFAPGFKGLVCEELVNFAQTTTTSALVQRGEGYDVRFAATIVSFNHTKQTELLKQTGVELIYLLTVADILDIAEEWLPKRRVDGWRKFLADPVKWQLDRGYELPKKEVA